MYSGKNIMEHHGERTGLGYLWILSKVSSQSFVSGGGHSERRTKSWSSGGVTISDIPPNLLLLCQDLSSMSTSLVLICCILVV